MAAAVQRKAMDAERQRFTLRQTRRTVAIIFSTMLVQASERRSSFGKPNRVTVRKLAHLVLSARAHARARRVPESPNRNFESASKPVLILCLS